MPLAEAGRYCYQCSKNVIDFSNYSKEAIIEYFVANNGKRICGRMRKSQIETIRIVIDQNLIEINIAYWKKFLIVLLVIFGYQLFGAEFTFAQTEKIDTMQQEKLELTGSSLLHQIPNIEDSNLIAPTTNFDSSTEMEEHVDKMDSTTENIDISSYALKNHFKLDWTKIECGLPLESIVMGNFIVEPTNIFEKLIISSAPPNVLNLQNKTHADSITQIELERNYSNKKTPKKEKQNSENLSFILPDDVKRKKLKANMPI